MKWIAATLLSVGCLQKALCVEEAIEPLYAGTLLSYYATNADPGKMSIQPYLYSTRQYGLYQSDWDLKRTESLYQNQLLLSFETGITKFLDVALDLNGFYKSFEGRQTVAYGDTQIYFGLQFARDKKGECLPDLRLVIGENFPTGKFDRLNPAREGADATGAGAFSTWFIFATRKVFYAVPRHPFNISINLGYIVSANTDVKGLSLYGSAPDTRDEVKPGDQFFVNLASELSFTRNWAIGMDIHYLHQNKSTFYSKRTNATRAGQPSMEVFSLSQCLEYNWSENLSVEAGSWFSVAGRNTKAFVGGVATVYYCF